VGYIEHNRRRWIYLNSTTGGALDIFEQHNRRPRNNIALSGTMQAPSDSYSVGICAWTGQSERGLRLGLMPTTDALVDSLSSSHATLPLSIRLASLESFDSAGI